MSNGGILAALVGAIAAMSVVLIAWYVVLIIAWWKMFAKAGEAGWKSLIPFYNLYILYKITWNTTMFWVFIALYVVSYILSAIGLGFVGVIGSIAIMVINIMQTNKLSKAFGHGIGYTFGLIFLNPIFMLILGFGGDQYEGPQ